MHRLQPHELWVGHAGDGRNFRQLHDAGIRAVVQLAAEEAPIATPREFISLRFPLVDGAGNDPQLLMLAVDAVRRLNSCAIPSLLCCSAGMSRSPVIAAAALSDDESALHDQVTAIARYGPRDVSPGLLQDVINALRSRQNRG